MKHIGKIFTVMAAMLVASAVSTHAQTSAGVEQIANEIVRKYEESPGVSCMTVVKGGGLEMIKMMLNKQFGKDFMKGVTSITIIDYSDASEETCMALRKDLDAFLSSLQEFDVSNEKQFAENDYIRCFASASGSGILSDFVIALEDDKSRMIMYMAGTILVRAVLL